MHRILISFLSLYLSACSHQQIAANDSNLEHYEFTYQRYSYNLQPIDDSFIDQQLSIIFPAISGAIIGSPSGEILKIANAQDGNFKLDVPLSVDGLAREISNSTLRIEPKDTRVLRMGTFHSYPYYLNLGDASFVNGENGNALIFVYFSQQVKIEGEMQIRNEIFDHDLNIGKAGWQWLEIAKISSKRYSIRRYLGQAKDIYFVVLLDNMAAVR